MGSVGGPQNFPSPRQKPNVSGGSRRKVGAQTTLASSRVRRPRPERLARKILSVEFHGYHSPQWRPIGFTLPSQHYSFWLVQQAMARGATVVIMRGQRDWEVSVPGLQDYERLVIPHSFRSPAISEGNCGRDGFERIVAALE
jgi:hypothetical protein